ncbi:MAG: ankyrin repeat domain-containing protein [Boseongicola sp.]
MLRILLFLLWIVVPQMPERAFAQPADLMLAAREGDLAKVIALLSSGAEPDPKGIATPLYFAAQGGHLEMAEALLEHGADPNAQSKWGTALHIAARRGHLDVAELLLRQGANPNETGGEFGFVPLHEAAEKGSVEIGQLLVDHGADVNARDDYFEPPISFAARRGRSEFVELMRASGATAIPVDPISDALANADLELGRIRSLECGVCHRLGKLEKGAGDGPRLWSVVGRPIASQEFDYSDSMRAQSGSWTFERLNAFLADPAGTVPGTNMFRGYVEDRTERINLIAFLRTLADDPVPLP